MPAVFAGAAQVVKASKVSALAFPIPDGIIHKVQLRHSPEIIDGEDGIEHGLEAAVFALRGQKVHLKEALVRPPLDFDEIRNFDDCRYFGEINALTHSAVPAVRHSGYSLREDS
jgi:hypothetical protein